MGSSVISDTPANTLRKCFCKRQGLSCLCFRELFLKNKKVGLSRGGRACSARPERERVGYEAGGEG